MSKDAKSNLKFLQILSSYPQMLSKALVHTELPVATELMVDAELGNVNGS